MNLYQCIQEAQKYIHISKNENLSFLNSIEASKDLAGILAMLSSLIENKREKKNRKFIYSWATNKSKNKFIRDLLAQESLPFWKNFIKKYLLKRFTECLCIPVNKIEDEKITNGFRYCLERPIHIPLQLQYPDIILLSKSQFNEYSNRSNTYLYLNFSESLILPKSYSNIFIHIDKLESLELQHLDNFFLEQDHKIHNISYLISINTPLSSLALKQLNKLILRIKTQCKYIVWDCSNIFLLSFILLYSKQQKLQQAKFLFRNTLYLKYASCLKILEQDILVAPDIIKENNHISYSSLTLFLKKYSNLPRTYKSLLDYQIASTDWHTLANYYLGPG